MGDLNRLQNSTPVQLVDANDLQVCDLSTSAPAGSESGLIVRNIPSGTQAVSGTVTASPTGTYTVAGTTTASPTGTYTVAGTVTAVPTGTQAVSGTVTAVPTGTQAVSGTVIASQSGTSNPWIANPNDPSPTTGTINAEDLSSSDVANSLGQTVFTGTPDSGSTVTCVLNGESSITLELSGTFEGTIQFEQSIDGGISYMSFSMEALETSVEYNGVNIDDNGTYLFRGKVGGLTNVRARCNSIVGGNLSINWQPSWGPTNIYIDNTVDVNIPNTVNIQGIGSTGSPSGGILTVQGEEPASAVPIAVVGPGGGDLAVTINGGTITAIPSGTQAVSGTVTAVPTGTQAVSGTVTATPTGTYTVAGTTTAVPSGTYTVTGTVAPTGTQAVSGTVTASPTGTYTVAGTVNATPTGTYTVAGTTTAVPSGTYTVTGSTTATPTGTYTVSIKTVASATMANVTVSTSTSTVLLTSNSSRTMACFFNDDNSNHVFIKWGATASSTSFTVKLLPQGFYELPHPIYTGVIEARANSSAVIVRTTES